VDNTRDNLGIPVFPGPYFIIISFFLFILLLERRAGAPGSRTPAFLTRMGFALRDRAKRGRPTAVFSDDIKIDRAPFGVEEGI
jgi:hypothetical protein